MRSVRKQEAAPGHARVRGRVRGSPVAPPFGLYVEGPRDRSILRAWAYRLMPIEARPLFRGCVILGGRRPDRALEHFRGSSASRGLCVLDCDGEDAPTLPGEDGLEFFTWTRRHIESYVLVPAAIRRVLRLRPDDRRVERLLSDVLPEGRDVSAWQRLDAKQLLGRNGDLARVLGRDLPLAQIARATREDELHEDVHELFGRIRGALGPEPARGGRPVF